MDSTAKLIKEPSAWYLRFVAFLALGPSRTLRAIWRNEALKGHQRRSLPGNWRRAAKRYRWFERAGAYDLEQARDILLEMEGQVSSMIKRDIDEINRLYDDQDKLLVHLRSKPISANVFLKKVQTLNAMLRLTDKALNRVERYRSSQEVRERGKPVLLAMPQLPACVSQPRIVSSSSQPTGPSGPQGQGPPAVN